jgi:hypothetical protein
LGSGLALATRTSAFWILPDFQVVRPMLGYLLSARWKINSAAVFEQDRKKTPSSGDKRGPISFLPIETYHGR